MSYIKTLIDVDALPGADERAPGYWDSFHKRVIDACMQSDSPIDNERETARLYSYQGLYYRAHELEE